MNFLIGIMNKLNTPKLNEEQLKLIEEYKRKDKKILNISLIITIAILIINPFLKSNELSLVIISIATLIVFSYLITKIIMKITLHKKLKKIKDSIKNES